MQGVVSTPISKPSLRRGIVVKLQSPGTRLVSGQLPTSKWSLVTGVWHVVSRDSSCPSTREGARRGDGTSHLDQPRRRLKSQGTTSLPPISILQSRSRRCRARRSKSFGKHGATQSRSAQSISDGRAGKARAVHHINLARYAAQPWHRHWHMGARSR